MTMKIPRSIPIHAGYMAAVKCLRMQLKRSLTKKAKRRYEKGYIVKPPKNGGQRCSRALPANGTNPR
jgi:hypothetical protein